MRLSAHTRNILYLFSGDIASRVLGFLATIYLARILGTSGFGIIHIGLAVLTYAHIISDSGLNFLGVRQVAGNPDRLPEFSGNLLSTRLILSLITFLIGAVVISLTLNSPELKKISIIYLLYIFPAALWLEWYFQGRKQMGTVALGRFWGMLVYFIFILLFVNQTKDILNVAWGWTMGILSTALLLWIIFIFKKNSIRFQWKPSEFRNLYITALPLGIAMIVSQVVMQFPAIYLGIVDTTSEVGIYSAAFKLTVLILIFDRVFYAIFFPTVSYYFQNKREKLESVFNNILKFTSTLALFVGLCSILSAHFLIKNIFSAEFTEAIPVFRFMVGYFIFTLISSVFTFTLIGMKLEKIYTKSLIAGMLVFLPGALILGKQFGAAGAAVSIILYILTSLIIMAVELKSHISINTTRALLIPVLATLLVFLPVLMAINLSLPLKLLITTGICLPAIAWLSGIGINEIHYLKRILLWN